MCIPLLLLWCSLVVLSCSIPSPFLLLPVCSLPSHFFLTSSSFPAPYSIPPYSLSPVFSHSFPFLLPSCYLYAILLKPFFHLLAPFLLPSFYLPFFTSFLTFLLTSLYLSCLLPEFYLPGPFHHCSLPFQLLEWTQSQEAGQSSSTIHTEVSFKQSSSVPLFCSWSITVTICPGG